jgi:hypothetical protein
MSLPGYSAGFFRSAMESIRSKPPSSIGSSHSSPTNRPNPSDLNPNECDNNNKGTSDGGSKRKETRPKFYVYY